MIVQNNQLDSSHIQLLQALLARCKSKDGSIPSLYPYLLVQKRAVSSNLLYFKKKALIGFLSTYFFFEKGCEIALVVDPSYRKQGIAKILLKQIMPLLRERGMETVIFSAPSEVNDAWLSQMGFQVDHTEYLMHRLSEDTVELSAPRLKIRPAHLNETAILSALDQACFAEVQNNLPDRFQQLLIDPRYTILVAFYHEEIIGKAHIRWDEKTATFSDIAVFPEQQNQGFGHELVAYCINLTLGRGKKRLILDVEPSNQKAIKLYSHFNFNVAEARTFWTLSIDKLQSLLDA